MLSTLPRLPILEAVAAHDPESTAVVHSLSGRRFTYGGLLSDVARARNLLQDAACGESPLVGERVAFLIENSYDYVGMSHNFFLRPPIAVRESLLWLFG